MFPSLVANQVRWMGCLSFAELPPSIKFFGAPLQLQHEERGTVRVKCLVQDPNAVSQQRL